MELGMPFTPVWGLILPYSAEACMLAYSRHAGLVLKTKTYLQETKLGLFGMRKSHGA